MPDSARPIGLALAAATCSLLGLQVPAAVAQGRPGTWDVEAGVLYYQEADGRVQATEPAINAINNISDETHFSFNFVVDSLSGASPNGATPSDQVQSFTGPSGGSRSVATANSQGQALPVTSTRTPAQSATAPVQTWTSSSSTPISTPSPGYSGGGSAPATTTVPALLTYNVQPKQVPLDPSFTDSRLAASLGWTDALNRDWSYGLGGHFSKEHDYRSIGANGSLSRYLNQKNTTLNFGLSYSLDTLNPVGGVPVAFSRMPLGTGQTESAFQSEFDADHTRKTDNKNVIDLLLGVTQVINRRLLMQFNYSLTWDQGDLTDPYKILSIIDDQAGSNYGGNLTAADGNLVYVYEKRPNSRLAQALYWQTKFMLDNSDIINASYRYMHNDWGMNSHTFELSYRWQMGDAFLEPDVRFYRQTQANFYQRYLTASQYNGGELSLPAASADYRLGDMTTATLGVKYGYHLNADQDLGLRLSYYVEHNTGDPGFGKLSTQNLYPDTKALIAQFTLTF